MTPREPRATLHELAQGQIDAEDARILAGLAAMYDTVDPLPAGLVDRVQFAITLDALHAEIAQLQRSGELAGTRSGGATEAQNVTFSSTHLTTMITISPTSGDRVRIDGWVAPGDGVLVELRTSDSSVQTTADADGRFVFEDIRRGMAQFVLRRPGESAGAPVITPAIEL